MSIFSDLADFEVDFFCVSINSSCLVVQEALRPWKNRTGFLPSHICLMFRYSIKLQALQSNFWIRKTVKQNIDVLHKVDKLLLLLFVYWELNELSNLSNPVLIYKNKNFH